MKTSILSVLVASSFLSVSAMAISPNYSGPELYIGAKAAQVSVEEESVDSFDDTASFGIVGGYTYSRYIGFEVEYLKSGKSDLSVIGMDGEYDLQSLSLFNTYRYQVPNSKAYLKARVGITRSEINLDVPELGLSDSTTGSGFAGGLGAGYRVTEDFHIEGAYTFMGGNVETELLSVGANYVF